MILFLDFDGVLHPKGGGGPRCTKMALLEALLREPVATHVEIVVSL
jgi:hypothetical protein